MTKPTVLVLGDPEVQHPLSEHFLVDHAVLDGHEGVGCPPSGFNADIILLAVSHEQSDGGALIRRMRASTTAPIVLLSTSKSVAACCEALRSGADDYVTSPVDYSELVARLQAILRRVHSPKHDRCLRLRGGELEISQTAREVRLRGRVISLTPTEFDLLWELAANPGQAVSRERLHTRVWGGCQRSSLRTVDSHMSHLRAALGESGQIIEMVFRVGYRLVEKPGAK